MVEPVSTPSSAPQPPQQPSRPSHTLPIAARAVNLVKRYGSGDTAVTALSSRRVVSLPSWDHLGQESQR